MSASFAVIRILSNSWLAMALLSSGLAWAGEPDSSRVRDVAAMLPPKPIGVGKPISDREAWKSVGQHPAIRQQLNAAEKLATAPLPEQPDALYLEFSRTGNRSHWQTVAAGRRNRIATFAMAECIENKGRFLKPLEATIQAICAERSWVLPAHDRDLKCFRGEIESIDLASSALSWDLATAVWLLQDKLTADIRKLIRDNLERRTFVPFRDAVSGRRKDLFWLRATHNWNAVCLGGTLGAALASLDSREDRAWFAVAAEQHIKSFLSGFSQDGYCSEGLGYWNYGFGYFVLLSETMRQATSGKLDLLSDPAARFPAQFGLRAEILNGLYPPIADCSPSTQPNGALMHYICERFNISASRWNQYDPISGAGSALHGNMIYAFMPKDLPKAPCRMLADELTPRTWFDKGGVLICRNLKGAEFAACLKGGHNAEHHNHNDVGSFSVVCGKTMVLCDPGSEVYTARTFSSKRYESKVLNSFGHAVPVLDGKLQRSGSQAQAVVKRTDFSDLQDVLELDIRSAYAIPELQCLDRQFEFHRGKKPSLLVRDTIGFSKAEPFETALITWSKWKRVSENELLVGEGNDAVQVHIDGGGEAIEISETVLKEDVHTRELPHRISIRLGSPVAKACVSVSIQPARNSN